jgi:membrane-associated phospholipid phosphatase
MARRGGAIAFGRQEEGALRSTVMQHDGATFRERPVQAAALAWLGSYLVLAAVILGLGFLLMEILLANGAGSLDGSVAAWFVDQRTSALNLATRWGSDLGSTGAILGIAVVALAILAWRRHWREAGFMIAALSLEFGVFLLATFLIDRARPQVVRLDSVPPTSSYPSGHTAASIVLYIGLAIVIGWLVRSAAIRTIAWVAAIAIPIVVGLCRMYRGMHHLTDVLASVILGVGALLLAMLIVDIVLESRRPRSTDDRGSPDPAQPERSIPLEVSR